MSSSTANRSTDDRIQIKRTANGQSQFEMNKYTDQIRICPTFIDIDTWFGRDLNRDREQRERERERERTCKVDVIVTNLAEFDSIKIAVIVL
jgi:hypothetical protein